MILEASIQEALIVARSKAEKTPATTSGLTPLQENFAHEYLKDFDAGKAYTRAGYKADPRTCRSNASSVLKNHKVAMRIAALVEERSRRTEVTADRVVLELARIGFSDLRNYMHWNEHGAVWHPSNELSDEAAPVVQEILETERELDDGGVYRTKRFKLYDKMAALKELAKHTGVGSANDQSKLNVNVNIEAEKENAKTLEQLYADADKYREENEIKDALPEEKAVLD
jgi:phage terminase small subunit